MLTSSGVLNKLQLLLSQFVLIYEARCVAMFFFITVILLIRYLAKRLRPYKKIE